MLELGTFLMMKTFFIIQGDLYLWVKLLLPGAVKRIYNMQNKQLIKIFSRYNQYFNQTPEGIQINVVALKTCLSKYFRSNG